LRQRTFVLKPDLKAAELEELARRLRERTPLFVIGKRSAHFLMYHATFARVIVVDPTAETFRSEQYPCYDTLIDCLLTGATGGPIITLIPFTPLPLGLPHPLRNHQTVALRGAPGDRIEQLVELIGTQAEAGKQLLVYNNALGTGQEVFCAECSQQIGCTRCGRQLFVHGDQEGLFCPRCHHLESVVSCPSCGSRQLGVEVIGVEGLARRVRQWLRKSQRRPTPRVGALDAERRKRIRVPNLSRTDVLIGTSTLFAPLKFYRPRTVIHVAQDLWRPSPGGFPEVAVINEMARLTSLYAGRIERTIVAAPEALADSLAAQLGADADHTQRELNAVRKQYGLPPYNTVVRFTLYGHREKAVSEFADEMAGQLQFSQQVLRWEQSRVLPRGRNAGFLLRGQVTLERFSPGIFHDLRRRAKGKRLDIVFSPQYY